MGYKKLPEIPRAERTYWSPERGGRLWQKVAGSRVKKYSYSPYTAKARERYTFYADIEMVEEIESPSSVAGKPAFKFKNFAMPAMVGTFLEFREAVRSGEVAEKIEIVSRGNAIKSIGYWRNRGERPE